jgi:hypothetical protein
VGYYAFLFGFVAISLAVGLWIGRGGRIIRSVCVFAVIAVLSLMVILYGNTLTLFEGTITVLLVGFHGLALAFFGMIAAFARHLWQRFGASYDSIP